MPRSRTKKTTKDTANKIPPVKKNEGKVTKRSEGVSTKKKAPKKKNEGKTTNSKSPPKRVRQEDVNTTFTIEEEEKEREEKGEEEKEEREEEREEERDEVEKEVDNNDTNESPNKRMKIASKDPDPVINDKSNKTTTVKKGTTTSSGRVAGPISHSSHRTIPGTVLVLGMGDLGQLGLGEDVMEKKYPTPIKSISNIVQVVCGGVHTVALDKDGKVYTWGCNDEGALGRSITDIEDCVPGPVDLRGVTVVQVSAGDSHSVALTDNGSVYAWGNFRDSDGAFGLVTPKPSFLPVPIYTNNNDRAVKIASGNNHILILTEKGVVYSCGCAECGQLGRVMECFSLCGGRRGRDYLLNPKNIVFPRQRNNKITSKFSDIFTGENTSYAISSNNQIYVWGDNRRSQLGLGEDTSTSLFVPFKVPDDWLTSSNSNICISGGDGHTVISNNGNVYTAGSNDYGQLGLPKELTLQTTPTKIKKFKSVAMVASGTRCSFAVDKSGEVFAWGIGSNSQLGCGQGENDLFEPTVMKKLESYRVLQISSGGQHTALLVNSRVDKGSF